MYEKGKRLGRIVKCPQCRKEVNPLVVTEYDAVREIPARVVVKCPADECSCLNEIVWYIPVYRIEELPVAHVG